MTIVRFFSLSFHPIAKLKFIIEATLKDGLIHITTNPTITASQFKPESYRLVDFNSITFQGTIGEDLSIKLNTSTQKIVSGKLAVELLGTDGDENAVKSNLVWVIELEVQAGDKQKRRLRRIFSDPSELFEVLKEITSEKDERELMLFLQKFDIPLDLLLLPRITHSSRNIISKGNVIGALPIHRSSFYSSTILAAYQSCIKRLLGKLNRHVEMRQADKIGNFVLILSSTLVLLDFVNAWVRDRYKSRDSISNEDWLFIRNCYDMLLKFSTELWELVWGRNGYRNVINAALAERSAKEEEEIIESFDQFLLSEYDNSIEELVEFMNRPLNTFKELKKGAKD